MGRLGALLVASWAFLGRSWGPLGQSWSVEPKNARTLEPLKKVERFVRLGTHFGVLLEPSWGVLGASGAVLRPSCASWSAIGPSRGPLGPPWGPFKTLLARLGALWQSRDTTRPAPKGARAAAANPRLGALGPWKSIYNTQCGGLRGPDDTPLRARQHGGGYQDRAG